MDRHPNTPFQHQPWPISSSTSPLAIPSPRLYSITPSAHVEWQKLCTSSQFHSACPFQFRSRSRTPPSLSPSPAPSNASYHYDSDIEIEELSDSPSDDSGIELLIGEYEEAPDNYGKTVYDSEDESVKGQRSILFGLEKLSATTSKIHDAHRRKAKRSYVESSGEESGCSYDSGISSVDSVDSNWGRRVRRRVVRKIPADDCVSVSSYDDSNDSSDNEIDMEL